MIARPRPGGRAVHAAWRARALHHAWLLAGPRGVGKARFARAAAPRVLAEAAGPPVDLPGSTLPTITRSSGWSRPAAIPTCACSSGSKNPRPAGARAQHHRRPGARARRPVRLDARRCRPGARWSSTPPTISRASAANALLKILEEPPANCLFLLVSHAPGRLLPTIRSRCRGSISSRSTMTP